MKYCVFSENEWIYPDSALSGQAKASLFIPRRADACFQILTDEELCAPTPVRVSFTSNALRATVYQLHLAHVGENSALTYHTTTDYESVAHFVTRKAPFDVFEMTRPLEDGMLRAGRLALYVRIDVPADATQGCFDETLTVTVGEQVLSVPIGIKVYNTCIPTLHDASFHMVNWIYYKRIENVHGVTPKTEEYGRILRAYLENQLDMRNDYLMLPSGEPIYDENGRVTDFDFSHAAYVGNLALSMGFEKIMGGFCMRFVKWDKPLTTLLWDRTLDVTSQEGYRQLSLYFRRAWECVKENGWEAQYYQCIEDEPQFKNSIEYRVVAAICRKHMPGVLIHDPVESTELGGGPDVWVVKQKTFEQYLDVYRALMDMGEEMWIYTCGFPAGATMNRIIDLPLSASLLPMWMCYKYGAKGFLHWGYHVHGPELEKETCCPAGEGKRYPAGNSFVVYPTENAPWYGVRGHLQRIGAYDYELLTMAGKKDPAWTLAAVERLCRSFDDYTADASLIARVRRELLEFLG